MISKYKIYSYTIPLLLGLCSGACSNILQNSGTLVLSDGSLYVAMAAYCALYCGAFWATEGIVGRSASRRDPIEGEREGGPSRGAIGRVVSCFGGVELTLRSVLSVGAAIFLLWLPYIVHLYPGVYWMDTSYQISEYVNLSDGAIGDQYPFLTTVIVGAFAKAGFALTGDYFLGTYLLILIQSALTAVALAALCCYIGRWGVSIRLRTLMAAFFALFPFFPCMMGTLCKDTLHLPFEIAFALLYAEAWRTRGENDGRILVPLVLAAAMASLTKKTGLIVCSGSLFALLLAVKAMHRKAQVAGALAVTLLLVSVVAPAVAGVAVSIVPGGRQEIYSVPLQIVANVARIEPAALSEDDLDLVRGTYPIRPDEIPESYQWQAADGVK